MRSRASNSGSSTRSSFIGMRRYRRTSAMRERRGVGAVGAFGHAIHDALHEHAVALREREGQASLGVPASSRRRIVMRPFGGGARGRAVQARLAAWLAAPGRRRGLRRRRALRCACLAWSLRALPASAAARRAGRSPWRRRRRRRPASFGFVDPGSSGRSSRRVRLALLVAHVVVFRVRLEGGLRRHRAGSSAG